MKSYLYRYAVTALIILTLVGAGACARSEPVSLPTPGSESSPATVTTPSSTPAPETAPEFGVVSLDIKPPEVVAGEAANITAVVENIGDTEGTHTVVLTVDGVTAGEKEITISAGSSKEVTFSLSKDTPGTYEIAIGELVSSLIVKEKPVARVVVLNHDDGEAETFLFFGKGYGHLVRFLPPAAPYTVKKVKMYGSIFGRDWEDKNFEVEIWGKDYKVLHKAAHPVSMLYVPPKGPKWVEVEVPDIKVTDEFYVHVCTYGSISLGADDSVPNLHSGSTFPTEGATRISTSWPIRSQEWFGDEGNVNWMIRVVGTAIGQPVPGPAPAPAPGLAIQIKAAHETERELETKAALEKLLAEYDVSKWIFTSSVLIEEGAIPHSHPVLTLSPSYLPYNFMLLSSFIHEQIHWFLSAKIDNVNNAIDELRLLYPEVPVGGLEGAKDEYSTYLHLIVNYLELSAMAELIGEDSAVSMMNRMGHYTWINETVLADRKAIGDIVRRHNLTIE
jgi:hypothetical protein